MKEEPGGPSADPDPGPPIAELADLGIPTSDSFVEHVRERLEIREGGIQIAEFSLGGLGEVAVAYVLIVLHVFSPNDRTRE